MKIPINEEDGLFSFVPTSLEEYDKLQEINRTIQMANSLSFVGPGFFYVLNMGGAPATVVDLRPPLLKVIRKRKIIVPQPRPNDSYRGVPVRFKFGDIPLVVQAATPQDDVNIWRIWTSCYYGRFKPIFTESRFPAGTIEMEFFLGNCKNCGRFCIDYAELEYMCNDCAKKCVHSYDFFINYAENEEGGRKLLVGQFCLRCRRANPDFDPAKFSDEEQEALVLSLLL